MSLFSLKENYIMTNEYFKLRNVDLHTYTDYKIPLYLSKTLNDRDASILDFGCGFGQLISALKAAHFSDVEGADIDSTSIESLRKRQIKVHDLSVDKDFYNDNAGRFDFVIMSHVLEHIAKNEIVNLLKTVKKLLKQGGHLIVMVPNAQSNTGCYWAYEDFTHNFLFTSGSLYYVLMSSGFSNVSFMDIDCMTECAGIKKLIKKFLFYIYKINYNFWNKVTSSSFHKQSPQIFSYELKAISKN